MKKIYLETLPYMARNSQESGKKRKSASFDYKLKIRVFPFYERKRLAKTFKTSNRRNRTRFSKAWKLKLDSEKLSGFFYVQKTN